MGIIGEQIKKFRLKKGYTQEKLGDIIGVTTKAVSKWERGGVPDAEILPDIADALNKPLIPYHVSADFLAETGKSMGYDFAGGLIGDKSVSVVFDNRKLKRAVPDMRTAVPFHVGVRKALDYILSHPECQKEDPEFDAWCDRVIAALEKAKKEV